MVSRAPLQQVPPAPGACKLQFKEKKNNKGKIMNRNWKREKKGKTKHKIMQPKEQKDMLS